MSQRDKDGAHDAGCVQPGVGIHLLGLGVIGERVGQHPRPNLQAAFQQAFMGKELQHMAGETADSALFHRHQHFVRAGQTADQIFVERFGETGVGNRALRMTPCSASVM